MRIDKIMTGVILAGFLAVGPQARAELTDAEKSYEQGRTLLSQADFEGAFAAFKAASKADPDNNDYFRECSILGQVIKYRAQLESEQDAEAWAKLSRGLYSYYRHYKINGEALTLATAIYAKSGCGESAAMLADAQLALDKNEAAAELLADLAKPKCTPRTELLYGIALARLNKAADARELAARWEMPKDCDAQTCFDAARLYARVGEKEKALEALKSSLEGTPAAWIADARAEAKSCKDLEAITGDAQFVKVLATESKVKGCGGCTKKCNKAKAGCQDKKKDGCQHDHDKEKL